MTYKAGEYCPTCEAFMAPDRKVECACGQERRWGSYCQRCDLYTGTCAVGKCPKCQKPYDKTEGWPRCTGG